MANAGAQVVAIGDLNGSLEALQAILRGLNLIDRKGNWSGRGTHLVQLGDVFNRGGGAKAAFEVLFRLREQAPEHGGSVTVLLANHEVMTVLGNEAYCTDVEYLAFATKAQRRGWPRKINAEMRRLYHEHAQEGPILPIAPRLEAWKALNAPGRSAMRRALGPRARLGRAIRDLPVAMQIGDTVFSHSALTPRWARMGIDGLNREARREWKEAPDFYKELPARGLLRDVNGPLWNRSLVCSNSERVSQQVKTSLKHLSARRMVVGHTMTRSFKGGKDGVITTRQRGKIVCIDVGLGRNASVCTALVIEGGKGFEWTPGARRRLWGS